MNRDPDQIAFDDHAADEIDDQSTKRPCSLLGGPNWIRIARKLRPAGLSAGLWRSGAPFPAPALRAADLVGGLVMGMLFWLAAPRSPLISARMLPNTTPGSAATAAANVAYQPCVDLDQALAERGKLPLLDRLEGRSPLYMTRPLNRRARAVYELALQRNREMLRDQEREEAMLAEARAA